MHTIKITPNLLFEYQCTSGKLIRLPNRIKSKLFFRPSWNALRPWASLKPDGLNKHSSVHTAVLRSRSEIRHYRVFTDDACSVTWTFNYLPTVAHSQQLPKFSWFGSRREIVPELSTLVYALPDFSSVFALNRNGQHFLRATQL